MFLRTFSPTRYSPKVEKSLNSRSKLKYHTTPPATETYPVRDFKHYGVLLLLRQHISDTRFSCARCDGKCTLVPCATSPVRWPCSFSTLILIGSYPSTKLWIELNNASLSDFRGKERAGCRKKFARYYSDAHTNNGGGGECSRNTYRILVVKPEETRDLRSCGLLRSE